MYKQCRYLIRKMAIIKNDGHFQNYTLVYLSGKKVDIPEIGECLTDISVNSFDRERASVEYLDTLTLKEIQIGIYQLLVGGA